jgi:hypothetical protein
VTLSKHPTLIALIAGIGIAICIGWLAALIVVVGKMIAHVL